MNLTIYLSTHLFICLVHLFNYSLKFFLFMYLPMHHLIYPPIHLTTYPLIYPTNHSFIYNLSIYPPIYDLSIHSSFYPSTHRSIHNLSIHSIIYSNVSTRLDVSNFMNICLILCPLSACLGLCIFSNYFTI